MALFKTFRGQRTDLNNVPFTDGYAYFCPDDGSFHIDCLVDGQEQRIQLNAKNAETLTGKTLEELKEYFLEQINFENGIDTNAVQQKLDTSEVDFSGRNPNTPEELKTTLDTGATGPMAASFNGNTMAIGSRATAINNKTIAYGEHTLAQGYQSVAYGNNSLAGGTKSTTLGDSAVAFGNESLASGDFSFADGNKAKAYGEGSMALGLDTTAQGNYSRATGNNTTALSENSYVGGKDSTVGKVIDNGDGTQTVKGYNAFAHGQDLVVEYDNQAAFGVNNSNDANTLFEVGCGGLIKDADGNIIDKANAFSVMRDGRAKVYNIWAEDDNDIIAKGYMEAKVGEAFEAFAEVLQSNVFDGYEQKFNTTEQSLSDLNKDLEDATKQLSSIESDLADATKQLSSIEGDLSTLEKVVDGNTSKIGGLTQSVDNLWDGLYSVQDWFIEQEPFLAKNIKDSASNGLEQIHATASGDHAVAFTGGIAAGNRSAAFGGSVATEDSHLGFVAGEHNINSHWAAAAFGGANRTSDAYQLVCGLANAAKEGNLFEVGNGSVEFVVVDPKPDFYDVLNSYDYYMEAPNGGYVRIDQNSADEGLYDNLERVYTKNISGSNAFEVNKSGHAKAKEFDTFYNNITTGQSLETSITGGYIGLHVYNGPDGEDPCGNASFRHTGIAADNIDSIWGINEEDGIYYKVPGSIGKSIQLTLDGQIKFADDAYTLTLPQETATLATREWMLDTATKEGIPCLKVKGGADVNAYDGGFSLSITGDEIKVIAPDDFRGEFENFSLNIVSGLALGNEGNSTSYRNGRIVRNGKFISIPIPELNADGLVLASTLNNTFYTLQNQITTNYNNAVALINTKTAAHDERLTQVTEPGWELKDTYSWPMANTYNTMAVISHYTRYDMVQKKNVNMLILEMYVQKEETFTATNLTVPALLGSATIGRKWESDYVGVVDLPAIIGLHDRLPSTVGMKHTNFFRREIESYSWIMANDNGWGSSGVADIGWMDGLGSVTGLITNQMFTDDNGNLTDIKTYVTGRGVALATTNIPSGASLTITGQRIKIRMYDFFN